MARATHVIWKSAYKLFNAAEKLPGPARLLARPRLAALRDRVLTRYVTGLPDRRYWNETIMPALLSAGFERVLFVGCAVYTARIHQAFEQQGIACWTTDIVPENAAWGNPRHHLVADIACITDHVPAGHFDAILFNGVMGYGVTGEGMQAVAPALHTLLRPGGLLLIGWNQGLVEDPLTLPWVTRLFSPGHAVPLPARQGFKDSTHTFDVLSRVDAPAD